MPFIPQDQIQRALFMLFCRHVYGSTNCSC